MTLTLKEILTLLQTRPGLAEAVAQEFSRCRDPEITSEALTKAMSPLLAKIGEQLDCLQAKVADLEVAERVRLAQINYLAAWPHHDVRPNGHGGIN